jgi:hypothetical protein
MAGRKRFHTGDMEVIKPDKAEAMRVHISGFTGLHPVRTGIAYWYRGHYLYGAVGNPIEPQLFATKGRLMLSGIRSESVPVYDPRDGSLVPEHTIKALEKTMQNNGYFEPRGAPTEEVDTAVAASEVPRAASASPSTVGQQHGRVARPATGN